MPVCSNYAKNYASIIYKCLLSVPKEKLIGGLMVSALVWGPSSPGSSPGQERCVVLLGKTIYYHMASSPLLQVYEWVRANLMLRAALRWASIPSRGSTNTPSRFMLQKPGDASNWWVTWLVCRLIQPLPSFNPYLPHFEWHSIKPANIKIYKTSAKLYFAKCKCLDIKFIQSQCRASKYSSY